MQLSLFDVDQVVQSKPAAIALSTKKLSAELKKLLSSAVISQRDRLWVVEIPQVKRATYEEFKKVLKALRGEWNGKCHIFPYDPSEKIAAIVESGVFPEINPNEFFPTPTAVGKELLDFIDLINAWEWEVDKSYRSMDDAEFSVLEPSAGTGNLVRLIREKMPEITIDCCEIDDFNREILQRQGFNLIGYDFLSKSFSTTYDWVVLNPPFEKYIEHVKKAFSLLKWNGRLGAIVPAAMLWRTDAKTVAFRNLVATYGDWQELPDNAFVESGTSTKCLIIKMENFSQAYLDELDKPCNGLASTWAFSIEIALDSEREWMEYQDCLVRDINEQKISKQEAYQKIGKRLDQQMASYFKQGYCYRYDEMVRNQVIASYWNDLKDRLNEAIGSNYVYSLEALEAMLTLEKTHTEDCKIIDGDIKVWLSRMTLEDGESYPHRVFVTNYEGVIFEYQAQ